MVSVFESFNAKNLSPLQVAKSFIPPARQFGDLCGRSHTVILGPRGSGKTTLLKMLQVQALAMWEHPKSEDYISRIDFSSVFIPADIVWKTQIDNMSGVNLPRSVAERLGTASFTSHIFVSLIAAFEAHSSENLKDDSLLGRFFSNIDTQQEALLVTTLAARWQIEPILPSFLGLRLSLRARLADIAALADQLDGAPEEHISNAVRSKNYLFISFYEEIIFALELFNSLSNSPDRQWALLFDELEIAPDIIRKRLLSLLRGTDVRVLLKLSMSPYTQDFKALSNELGGKPGHDFVPIPLWYSDKEEAIPFASELSLSILEEAGKTGTSPTTIFGTSEFDLGREEQRELGSAYRPGSSNHRRFSDLAARDSTFRAYLDRIGIDLKRMHEIDDAQRAAQLRKLTSVVTVREAFLRAAGDESHPTQKASLRSRKKPQIYTGASALFAITEGNPRWIIGTLGPLLKAYAVDGTVKRTLQSRTVAIATDRFRALLSTVPVKVSATDGRRSLLSVVDVIGTYFHNRMVRAPFQPEPPSTFIVDEATPEGVVRALEAALNVGAIVLIPVTPDQKMIDSIVGNRFRLTYLLAPHYRLALTVGKERNLSNILSDVDSTLSTLDLFPA